VDATIVARWMAVVVMASRPRVDPLIVEWWNDAAVADVGRGYGAATMLMGQAYPSSTFVGFDYHDTSIAAARGRANDADLDANVTFEVASATDFPGRYDLVCLFDCLHDVGDPVGVARHVRQALRLDGVLLLVEPNGADRPEDNHHFSAGCSPQPASPPVPPSTSSSKPAHSPPRTGPAPSSGARGWSPGRKHT